MHLCRVMCRVSRRAAGGREVRSRWSRGGQQLVPRRAAAPGAPQGFRRLLALRLRHLPRFPRRRAVFCRCVPLSAALCSDLPSSCRLMPSCAAPKTPAAKCQSRHVPEPKASNALVPRYVPLFAVMCRSPPYREASCRRCDCVTCLGSLGASQNQNALPRYVPHFAVLCRSPPCCAALWGIVRVTLQRSTAAPPIADKATRTRFRCTANPSQPHHSLWQA
jgi:hypothetical protein